MFIFSPSLKKNISLFDGELLLKQLSIQSINKFLENRDQNSLTLQYFTKYLRLTIVSIIMRLELQNKSNLKEFSYGTESFKYYFFPFCVGESNSLENSMREAKSFEHFKSMLMQVFTLFSRYSQYMTK